MASAVARQAAKRPVGVLPPSSPFAELLRRSRFATFDPEIKQTYSAPPAYAHRGSWGLKRPIAQRRKNAYITLKSYEDHAQYIEWNNAEAQVRFMKRFEELNVTPTVITGTPFSESLGPAKSGVWLTDSEFDTAKDNEYVYATKESAPERHSPPTEPGTRGPGNYANMLQDVKAPLVTSDRKGPWNYRQPNFEAMTAEEFDNYIEKLRTLRPAFFERIRSELAARAKADTLRSTILNPEMSDLNLAMVNTVTNDHRTFLNEFFENEYNSRSTDAAALDPESGDALPKDFVRPKIKPQPHRNGALMYAHPSKLDTYFSTTPKPALVLESLESARFAYSAVPKTVKVSFGGLVAQLSHTPELGAVQPLFTKTSGPEGGVTERSVVDVRVAKFDLESPPSVVGKEGQGLNGVLVREQVVASKRIEDMKNRNPHVPGSMEYVGWQDPKVKAMNMRSWHQTRVPRTTISAKKATVDSVEMLRKMVPLVQRKTTPAPPPPPSTEGESS